MNLLPRGSVRPFLWASLGLAVIACGVDSEGAGDGLWVDQDGDDLATGPSNDDGASTGDDGLDSNGQCRALGLSESCAGEVFEGEAAALDLLLVFDESGSMSTKVDQSTGETRLDIVRGALDAFMRDSESTGIGIGLSYFGHMPLGETSCEPADYAELAVPFGVLPDHAGAVIDSLGAQKPTGETPTGAAIRAACDLALAHREETTGVIASILLVTDGEPKAPLSAPACDPTLSDAVEAAKTCFEKTGLSVYVLGVGPSLQNLNQIAEAGGTDSAYLADLDNRDQVLAALQRIRIAAQIPCGFAIAPSVSEAGLDYKSSTVAYVDDACTYAGVALVDSPEGCEEGARGYYFDHTDAPTRIDLCPSTCSEVRSRGKQLFYSIGCPLDVDIFK